MWVYGSIWDAPSWAKADYRYQPFVAMFNKFIFSGCPTSDSTCSFTNSNSIVSTGVGGLTSQERKTMTRIHKGYLVYKYCKDHQRYSHRLPECRKYRSNSGINNLIH
eukprot:Gb_07225 [translate_table: standard]